MPPSPHPPPPPPEKKMAYVRWQIKIQYFTFWYVILGKSIFLVKIALSANLRAN